MKKYQNFIRKHFFFFFFFFFVIKFSIYLNRHVLTTHMFNTPVLKKKKKKKKKKDGRIMAWRHKAVTVQDIFM